MRRNSLLQFAVLTAAMSLTFAANAQKPVSLQEQGVGRRDKNREDPPDPLTLFPAAT
jgi:hypothetical protein